MTHLPVVISGAGPVGLTLSLLLSDAGIPNMVLEKRPSTSPLPRARGVFCRTSEIWRQLGLVEEMERLSLSDDWTRVFLYTTALDGEEIGRTVATTMDRAINARRSPGPFLCLSQERIDAALHAATEDRDRSDVRFLHEVVHVYDDGDRVVVDVDGPEGERRQFMADWFVGADGGRSPTREWLGIELEGVVTNRWYLNVHFRADLRHLTPRERRGALIWVIGDETEGVLQPLDGEFDWSCGINFDATVDPPEGFDDGRVLSLVRSLVGRSSKDIDIELLGYRPWTVSSQYAQAMRRRRVFLAGDAAHLVPPFGGIGMNTGIQDAHALAWRLVATIEGWAGSQVLDSYEPERLEVAQRVCRYGLANLEHVRRIRALPTAERVAEARQYGNWAGVDVGVHYRQGAFVPDGSRLPAHADSIIDFEPSARPGFRAPHVWLDVDGQRQSTVDLFHGRITLLAGPDGAAWATALDKVHLEGAPVQAVVLDIDASVVEGDLLADYELERGGAVLVRPDGHVAFRARGPVDAPVIALQEALDTVLGGRIATSTA